jgi:putative transposase
MIILSDAGWSAPPIAKHLDYCGQTFRDLLRAILAYGHDALYQFRSGPPPDTACRDRVAEALRRSLTEDRNWTDWQLSDALAEREIALGARQVRRHLTHIEAGYRRTASTSNHKQDSAKAERAAKVLANLKAKATVSWQELYRLDEWASHRRCRSTTAESCRSSGS